MQVILAIIFAIPFIIFIETLGKLVSKKVDINLPNPLVGIISMAIIYGVPIAILTIIGPHIYVFDYVMVKITTGCIGLIIINGVRPEIKLDTFIGALAIFIVYLCFFYFRSNSLYYGDDYLYIGASRAIYDAGRFPTIITWQPHNILKSFSAFLWNMQRLVGNFHYVKGFYIERLTPLTQLVGHRITFGFVSIYIILRSSTFWTKRITTSVVIITGTILIANFYSSTGGFIRWISAPDYDSYLSLFIIIPLFLIKDKKVRYGFYIASAFLHPQNIIFVAIMESFRLIYDKININHQLNVSSLIFSIAFTRMLVGLIQLIFIDIDSSVIWMISRSSRFIDASFTLILYYLFRNKRWKDIFVLIFSLAITSSLHYNKFLIILALMIPIVYYLKKFQAAVVPAIITLIIITGSHTAAGYKFKDVFTFKYYSSHMVDEKVNDIYDLISEEDIEGNYIMPIQFSDGGQRIISQTITSMNYRYLFATSSGYQPENYITSDDINNWITSYNGRHQHNKNDLPYLIVTIKGTIMDDIINENIEVINVHKGYSLYNVSDYVHREKEFF